jgi:hypothetical protein
MTPTHPLFLCVCCFFFLEGKVGRGERGFWFFLSEIGCIPLPTSKKERKMSQSACEHTRTYTHAHTRLTMDSSRFFSIVYSRMHHGLSLWSFASAPPFSPFSLALQWHVGSFCTAKPLMFAYTQVAGSVTRWKSRREKRKLVPGCFELNACGFSTLVFVYLRCVHVCVCVCVQSGLI